MKTNMNKPTNIGINASHLILHNTLNYKLSICNAEFEILNKFIEVIIEYMTLIVDKIIIKNRAYFCFIFEKGIETLIHVFSIIFYYTKNLELTFYHTQKAFYFYVEFIEQISDDNITFLQLSSRDAVLFVYKKTIFDINNEYKKNIPEPTDEDKYILQTIEVYINMYKHIIISIIEQFKINQNNDCINIYITNIKHISNILHKHRICMDTLQPINAIITKLTNNNIETNTFFKILEEFIKKIIIKKSNSNSNLNINAVQSKINSLNITDFIINNEIDNIVELIFLD